MDDKGYYLTQQTLGKIKQWLDLPIVSTGAGSVGGSWGSKNIAFLKCTGTNTGEIVQYSPLTSTTVTLSTEVTISIVCIDGSTPVVDDYYLGVSNGYDGSGNYLYCCVAIPPYTPPPPLVAPLFFNSDAAIPSDGTWKDVSDGSIILPENGVTYLIQVNVPLYLRMTTDGSTGLAVGSIYGGLALADGDEPDGDDSTQLLVLSNADAPTTPGNNIETYQICAFTGTWTATSNDQTIAFNCTWFPNGATAIGTFSYARCGGGSPSANDFNGTGFIMPYTNMVL